MVKQLFNVEEDFTRFLEAVARLQNQHDGDLNARMDLGDRSDPSYIMLKSAANKLLASKQGFDVMVRAAPRMSEYLSDNAQLYLMYILNNEAQPGSNIERALVEVLRNANTETQIEHLNGNVFLYENIESDTFNQSSARLLFDACDDETKAYTLDNIEKQTFEKLALYAYGVEVHKGRKSTMTLIQTEDMAIPFERIEDDEVKQHCMEDEMRIHESMKSFSPDFTDEQIQEMRGVYEGAGIKFDIDKIKRQRSEFIKECIMDQTPEDHWSGFLQHQRALKAVITNSPDQLSHNFITSEYIQ